MRVNICGVHHEVIKREDSFDSDSHLGMINYVEAKILINNKLNNQLTKETICHEMIHGILIHIGRDDLSSDEQFVQSLGNAIYQGFDIREVKEKNEENNDN